MGQDKDKKSFLLYYSLADVVELLDDHQIANLFRAILSTGGVMEMPDLDALTNMAFVPIKRELEENYEKWLESKKNKAEAGRKGGLKKAENLAKASSATTDVANLADASSATNCLASASTSSSATTDVANLANLAVDVDVDVDADVDADVDVNNNIYCPSGDGLCADSPAPVKAKSPSKREINAHFDELWNLVPRKEGKSNVKDTTRKKLMSVSVDDMRTYVERYKKQVEADRAGGFDRNWLMGSTWFNSERWKDYTGDNYTEPAPLPRVVNGSFGKSKGGRYQSNEGYRDFSALEE